MSVENSSNVKVSSRDFQISKIRWRATVPVHPHLSDEEVGQHGVLDAQGVARSVKIFSALSISDSILSISGWSKVY